MTNLDWVREKLLQRFPEARIDVRDERGDDQHLAVNIVSTQFQGMSPVSCHRLVYEALEGQVGHRIHALSLRTSAVD
jgi:stress-induced morphogen